MHVNDEKSSKTDNHWLKNYLREIQNFPSNGVTFFCFAKLLQEPLAFSRVINLFAERYTTSSIQTIAALDARGFIFGSALAYAIKKPFVMLRKPGKLPGQTRRINYDLEYGSNSLEIQSDSIRPNCRVLLIDDILATGGTAKAACDLVNKLQGNVVEFAFLLELKRFGGREMLAAPCYSILTIE